jgi:hypothetical protein
LLADVAANFFEFKPDRANGVPSSPQVLTGKVPFLATESGNGNCCVPALLAPVYHDEALQLTRREAIIGTGFERVY